MLFYLLDLIFWLVWDVVWWTVLYLGPVILLVQLIRLIRADADLTVLTYEQFGKMPSSLRGKVVWITGASSGIGENLAYVLIRSGCKLVLSARRKEELDRVKQTCLEQPGTYNEKDILVLPLDLLAFDTHKDLANKAVEHFGRIDVLVNNAARSQFVKITDTPITMDKELIDVLVCGPVSLTKAVLPHFIKQKSGQVVVTSSVAGKMGAPNSATYCLGKFALHGWFETLRMEHAVDNIDVVMICPGPVKTNLLDAAVTKGSKGLTSEEYEKYKYMTPQRCGQLISVAMANKLPEAWLTPQPFLGLLYIGQYTPGFWQWICKPIAKRMVVNPE